MSKTNPRFVKEFMGEYIGDTREDFAANLSRLMGRSLEFLKLCNDDLDFAKQILRAHDSQETRRILIRTVPPFIEGKLTYLRTQPYLFPPLLEKVPKDCEVLFAEPMMKLRNRSSAKDSIKRTLVGIGVVAGIDIPHNLMGESGAQALMDTFELRDSLMHPQSIEGFTVSDDQIQAAHTGLRWFEQYFASVFAPMIKVAKEISGGSSCRP